MAVCQIPRYLHGVPPAAWPADAHGIKDWFGVQRLAGQSGAEHASNSYYLLGFINCTAGCPMTRQSPVSYAEHSSSPCAQLMFHMKYEDWWWKLARFAITAGPLFFVHLVAYDHRAPLVSNDGGVLSTEHRSCRGGWFPSLWKENTMFAATLSHQTRSVSVLPGGSDGGTGREKVWKMPGTRKASAKSLAEGSGSRTHQTRQARLAGFEVRALHRDTIPFRFLETSPFPRHAKV